MELEEKVKKLIEQGDNENFIYEFLLLYGIPKVTITKTKNSKLKKAENQIIIKKKLFFEYYNQGVSLFEAKDTDLLERINVLTNDPQTYAHDPRFIIVTDYKRFLAVDTKTKDTRDIEFKDLWKHTDFFLPWAGKEKYQPHVESMADVKAAEKMAKIYDEIYHNNKTFANEYNHDLNVFLTRLLFCFFAEDTGIFTEDSLFTKSLVEHTQEDGSDLKEFFEVLFASLDKQDKSQYPQYIQRFPYVNGKLFRDTIHIPELTTKTRELMIECGDRNNWKEINPDIFGSMFQAVKTAEARSDLEQHYTSVPNIMKVINPLFMDNLREEFEKNKDNINKLKALQARLGKIRIFDPACGSGNFLIIAFKQMKLLEMDIIKRIQEISGEKDFQMNLSVIELKQFYGIEIDDFACEIAKLSLWLAEHQMNCKFREEIGEPKPTLPLSESGHIVCGNALRMDWEEVCPKYIEKTTLAHEVDRADLRNTPLKLDLPKEEAEVYVLGNPPYKGFKYQTDLMKSDIEHVFSKFKTYKKLDYIACWFYLAAIYIRNTTFRYAFVSTNSVTQGELVSLIWPRIFQMDLEICFAHTSFKWSNNAKHNAGVTCVIIGIAQISNNKKYLYMENNIKFVKHITPFLSDDTSLIITKRSTPLSNLPPMLLGSLPADGGALILTENEKECVCNTYPELEKYIKPFIGSNEYINDIHRFCLWLPILPKEIENNDFVKKRLKLCKQNRLDSNKKETKARAETPYSFAENRYRNSNAILIPVTSSEKREYIPMGFVYGDNVIYHSAVAIYCNDYWVLGVVLSKMHMEWIRKVSGKLENRIRYSPMLCYNTFPFPKISEQQKKQIELRVQEILRVREKYSEKTMAELYDPDKMPKDLLDAHHSLDMVIESCYRKKPFENDEQRLAHLFKMYEMMTNNASEEELKQLELGV